MGPHPSDDITQWVWNEAASSIYEAVNAHLPNLMRCTRARGFRRRRQPLAWALGVGTCMPHVRLRLGTESESEGTKKMLCAYLPNFAHRFYSISFVPRPIYLRRLRSAQCVSRTRPMDTGRYTSLSYDASSGSAGISRETTGRLCDRFWSESKVICYMSFYC